MAERIEELITQSIRQNQEYAWEVGFEAGRLYGREIERYGPDEYEPEKPRNPFKLYKPGRKAHEHAPQEKDAGASAQVFVA